MGHNLSLKSMHLGYRSEMIDLEIIISNLATKILRMGQEITHLRALVTS